MLMKNSRVLALIAIFWVQESCGVQKLNVLFVNEYENVIAEKAVETAVAYIKDNAKFDLEVSINPVFTNRSDSVQLLKTLCSFVNDTEPPHLVFDATLSGLSSETVKSFTRALSLPTISASFGQKDDLIKWRELSEVEAKFLIQINPPADVVPEIIPDIVELQNITNAAILFDKNFIMSHKYKSLFQNIATRNLMTAIDRELVQDQIEKLVQLNLMNFFVLAAQDLIQEVLSVASKNSYLTEKFAWHLITLDSEDFNCNQCSDGRILHVKPMTDPSFQEKFDEVKTKYNFNEKPEITASFYLDLAVQSFLATGSMLKEGWPEVMNEYISCDTFNGTNSPSRQGFDLETALKTSSSEGPTFGPLALIYNGKSSIQFEMDLSIHSYKGGKLDKKLDVGIWDASFDSNLTITDPESFLNFTSAQIYRVVVAEQKPYLFKDPKHPRGYNGYCIDMMDLIAKMYGFQYQIQLATGNVVGQLDDKGNWNGMIKDLMEKKADIGLGPISVAAEREQVIEFTVPYHDLVGYLVMVKNVYTPPSLFKFLTVLEDDVWICILVAYFITSFLLWLFDKHSPYSYQNNKEKYKDDEEKRIFYFRESLWFCITSCTPQGGGEAPKNLSGRLVAATWWLFGFIIIASYTANLAAFLTVSRLETPIESLDDLTKQYRVTFGPVNGSTAMIYFKRMADIENKFYEIWKDISLNDSLSNLERSKLAVWDYPISDKFTKIWQTLTENKLPSSNAEALARVKASKSPSDGFAFIGDASVVKYMALTNCDVKYIGEQFSMKPYALALQQGSPLKENLNSAILKLINKRDLEALRIKWWDENPERAICPDPENPSEGISAENIGGIFIVFVFGIGLGIGVLCIEYYYHQKEKEIKLIRMRNSMSGSKTSKGSIS